MDHDQSFKNLILDYPAQALEFFANVQDLAGAVITPIREEQLQEKLGSHYRRLDVPLQVEPAVVAAEFLLQLFLADGRYHCPG
ncbi:MAG: hypothetical protein ACKN9T_10545 [Candidatus Methylumidiphilus sp.]